MTKYEKFARELAKSGLSQRAYADNKGIKYSTVVYYLKRYREEQRDENSGFSKLELNVSKDRYIRIVTSTGLEIEIPV